MSDDGESLSHFFKLNVKTEQWELPEVGTLFHWIFVACGVYQLVISLFSAIVCLFKSRIIAASRRVADIAVTLRIKEELPGKGLSATYVLVFQPTENSTAARLYDALPGRRFISSDTGRLIVRDTPLHQLRFEKIEALPEF